VVFVCLNIYYSNNNTNTSSSSSNFMHLFSYSHCVMLSFVLYTVDSESSDSDNQFSDNNDQLEGAHRNDNDSTVTDDKCQVLIVMLATLAIVVSTNQFVC